MLNHYAIQYSFHVNETITLCTNVNMNRYKLAEPVPKGRFLFIALHAIQTRLAWPHLKYLARLAHELRNKGLVHVISLFK